MDEKVAVIGFREDGDCKVLAADLLFRGQRSTPFEAIDVVSSKMTVFQNTLYVGVDSNNILQVKLLDNKAGWKNWPLNINISPDIHSSNIHLVACDQNLCVGQQNSGMFALEIIKDVQKEEELLLWFSEDILALVDMPFLTPKNITGHKIYRCHRCEENFEYPNPLKMHLLLSCGRESIKQLWDKLHRNKKNQLYLENLKIHQVEALFKYSDRPSSANVQPCSLKSVLESPRCISEPPTSAFLPYKKIPLTATNNNKMCLLRKLRKPENYTTQQPLNLSIMNQEIVPNLNNWNRNMLEPRVTRSFEELSGNYAADVELFASNWGKLKHGHLCVYCGKVYSRKYGLKIHIRTHTGYKPLKCKFCLRPFGDPSNLNKHVRLHATASGLTPYACGLCGKLLVRRRDLERHLKSQHSSDDEKCIIEEIKSE